MHLSCNDDWQWLVILAQIIGVSNVIFGVSVLIYVTYNLFFKKFGDRGDVDQMSRLNGKIKGLTVVICAVFAVEIMIITTNVIIQMQCTDNLENVQKFFENVIRASTALHLIALFLLFKQFSMKLVILLDGTLFRVSIKKVKTLNIMGM